MTDLFTQTLDRLSRVSGVRGALIVETEAGLPIMAELSEGVEGSAVAALAASLYRRADRASQTAELGGLATLQLEGDAGHVIVADAGEVLVVVVAERTAQIGMVRLEAHRAAEALR